MRVSLSPDFVSHKQLNSAGTVASGSLLLILLHCTFGAIVRRLGSIEVVFKDCLDHRGRTSVRSLPLLGLASAFCRCLAEHCCLHLGPGHSHRRFDAVE